MSARMKKIVLVLGAFALISTLTFGAVSAFSRSGVQVQSITESSACPVTGCASGSCHSYDDVPEPDGVTELVCPESACSSTQCHAWDSLMGRTQASDASLNLWIMLPALIVAAAVVAARRRR